MTYRTVTLEKPTAAPDGTLVLVSGTDTRQVTRATLRGPDGLIELSGEPFDWSLRHGTDLDIWEQLWRGPDRRLIVHNARITGDGRRPPRRTPTVPAGTALRITARVQHAGPDRLAVTADRHAYLLSGPDRPYGYHHLTGTLLQESPPPSAGHGRSRPEPRHAAPHRGVPYINALFDCWCRGLLPAFQQPAAPTPDVTVASPAPA